MILPITLFPAHVGLCWLQRETGSILWKAFREDPLAWSWRISANGSLKVILVNVILNIRGKHFLGGFVQVVMENFRMPLWRGIVKWQRSVTEWQVIECFQHWFASPHCFLLSVQAQNLFVRGSKDNTKFEAKLTSSMLRKGFNTNKLMIIELID